MEPSRMNSEATYCFHPTSENIGRGLHSLVTTDQEEAVKMINATNLSNALVGVRAWGDILCELAARQYGEGSDTFQKITASFNRAAAVLDSLENQISNGSMLTEPQA